MSKDVPTSIKDESKNIKKVTKPKKLKIISQIYKPNPSNTASVKYPEVLHDVYSDGSTKEAVVKRKDTEGHKSIQNMSPTEFGEYSLNLGGQYEDWAKPKQSMSWARRVSGYKR